MWAWIAKYILAPIIIPLLMRAGEWLVKMFKRKKTDKENIEKYEDALKEGTDEERIDAGTDLLNGK